MMRTQLARLVTLVILLALLAMQSGQVVSVSAVSAPQAAKNSPVGVEFYNQPTDQIIVKYRDTGEGLNVLLDSAGQVNRLSQAAGVPLIYQRAMSGGAQVMRLAEKKPVVEVQAIAERLAQLSNVEYAEPDRILYHTMIPNDTYYANQWHYAAPGVGNYGINLPAAWDITTGSASVVVAVVDSGITNHPDLDGRTVPGYDFITNIDMSNDGDGRDADASDPGDWTPENYCYRGFPAHDSFWYGTHIAGIIGAASNNAAGVAGINWNSKILPVRVLGRCGGYQSDIVDGMRWAAGLSVTGVPTNANPAKVLNLSLGASGSCSTAEQSAISAITAAGTTVVVAAGNSSKDASDSHPGNCNGVITVAATDRSGDRASYSNYGTAVEIAAPGGEGNFSIDSILSTWNASKTFPGTPAYQYYEGTSFATAHVSGVVSLLYSVRPSLTPSQVLNCIQSTATSFPAGSTCTMGLCGSGIVNAGVAVVCALPNKLNTTTTITSHLPNPSKSGQAVTVHYTVASPSGSGMPTGTVKVSDGADSCTDTVAAGQCTFALTKAGANKLTATYTGDANYNGSASSEVAHTVQLPSVKIYLPLTFHRYFNGPMESEPNNTYLDANGPIKLGKEYVGYPNDAKDYFSFYISTTTNISVVLNDHTGDGVQLQLFYQNTNPENWKARDYSPPYSLYIPSAQPGWYYVYIYTESGYNSTSLYRLIVNP